jgi:hypothetical protein
MFIPDPGSKNSYKREGFKKKFWSNIFLYLQMSQNVKLFYFYTAQEKNLGQIFKELWNLLPKKLSQSSRKYESGIRDPGVKKAPDPGSRIRNTGCVFTLCCKCIKGRIRMRVTKRPALLL